MKNEAKGQKRRHFGIRRTKADIATDALETGFRESEATELLALTVLDEKLATGFLTLLPKALEAANKDKPDTRLLRLITRYTASRARFLQSKHRPQ